MPPRRACYTRPYGRSGASLYTFTINIIKRLSVDPSPLSVRLKYTPADTGVEGYNIPLYICIFCTSLPNIFSDVCVIFSLTFARPYAILISEHNEGDLKEFENRIEVFKMYEKLKSRIEIFKMYEKLQRIIKEEKGTKVNFETCIGITSKALYNKLRGANHFTVKEVIQICKVLNIRREELHEYFFEDEVWNTMQPVMMPVLIPDNIEVQTDKSEDVQE